jgi:hypothetical protein
VDDPVGWVFEREAEAVIHKGYIFYGKLDCLLFLWLFLPTGGQKEKKKEGYNQFYLFLHGFVYLNECGVYFS